MPAKQPSHMSLGCRTRFASLFALEHSLNLVGATREDPRVDTLVREIEAKAVPGMTAPPLDQRVQTIVSRAVEWVQECHADPTGGRYGAVIAALSEKVQELACDGCSALGVCGESSAPDN